MSNPQRPRPGPGGGLCRVWDGTMVVVDNDPSQDKNEVPRTKGRTTETGVAAELEAAAYLTRRGYFVFRQLSNGAPFDLVAFKNGRTYRIEVKSGRRRPGGGYAFGRPERLATQRAYWDLLIYVFPDRIVCVKRGTTTEEVRKRLGE